MAKTGDCPICGEKGVSMQNNSRCWKCYRKQKKEDGAQQKPPEGPSEAPESKKPPKDDILDKLIGGEVIRTPPDPSKPPKGGPAKPGAAPPGPGPAAAMTIPPSLFKMIGHGLAKMTDTEEFELDTEGATYLADMLREALKSRGTVIDPMKAFIIAMVMWLGMGFAAFAFRKVSERKKKKKDGPQRPPTSQPEEKREGLIASLMSKRGEQQIAKDLQRPQPVQQPPIPPPAAVAAPPPVPGFVPKPNPEFKQVDLAALQEQAAGQMEKEITKNQRKKRS
jgi:hypothetical protein